MSRSPTPPPSSARGRLLGDTLGVRSFFRRRWRSLTPSVRSRTLPPAQSAPSAASLTSPEATSPSNTGSSVTPPADSSAISTVVSTDSVAPMIIVRDEPIEDPKTQRWNAAMAECQRRMGVDFLGPETAEFRSEKDVMAYIAGRENTEPDSEGKGRWQKLQRGLVPMARVSKIFCDPIADTISDSFPPSKIVFAAVGLIISASIATHEEFEQITDALEEIKVHLQVIEMVAGHRGQLLTDTSVNLLVQVIIVLSVIAKMRRDGYVGRFCDAVKGNRPLSDALKVLEKTSSRHKAAIGAGTLGIVANIEASDELKEIRRWLGYDAVEPFQTRRINTLLNDCAKGTCSWLWRNREFAKFLEGCTKILSVEGKAGCGKSTTIASAISHLRTSPTQIGSEHMVLAHFFDVAYRSNAGDLDSLLSSFLYQLAAKDCQCMGTLTQAWALSKSNGYFTCDEKLNTLLGMLGNRLRVFLIIDALDEAAKNEHAQVLGALRKLRSCANISILVSTRVPLADENLLHAVVPIDRVEDNTDIRTALDIEFSNGGRLFGIAQAEMVQERLMMKADGNMRWLTLVIEQLRDAVNDPRRLGQLLSTLPFTLEELYGKRLEDIRRDLVDDTKLLFMWIIHSNIPLTTSLLSRVLAFNYDARMPEYVPTFVSPNPAAQLYGLLDSTFISITEVQVRIAHASVRDFLVTLSPSSPFYTSSDDAVCLMVRTSLAYLLAVVKHDRSMEYDDDLLQLWHRCMFDHEGDHYARLEKDITDVLGQIGASHPLEGILSPALRSAVIQGHEWLVSLLLKNGVDGSAALLDPSERCAPSHRRANKTALHLAAEHGHSGVAELLLERGANIAARTRWQDTPLTLAAHNDKEDVVRLLLEKGADIENCDKDGCTSLHRAAGRGHRGSVSLLLDRGAHIAAQTKQQDTPLTIAAGDGHEDIVRLLLDKGADIEDCDKDGCTSLHRAAGRGHRGTVSLLLDRGARIAARTEEQETPLMLAACNNHEDVVCLLLTKGADIDDCDKDGWTSLHWAVLLGQLSTARLLLERGANVNAVSNAYPTPLHIATHHGHIDIIRLLVDHGAALEARDDDGCTPLYHAVYNIEEEEAIALLLSFGSDPHTRADDGTTLLDAVGRESSLSRDAERAARVRELLMRAGCTEETGREPLENWIQPEDTREGAESS